MPDSYYPDAEASFDDNSTTASDQNPEPSKDTQKNDDAEEALVPISFFGDTPPEVGSTCTVRVTHVFDDEVSISYEHSEDKSKADESGDQMGRSMNDLTSMADGNSRAY